MANDLSIEEFIARQGEYEKNRRMMYPLFRSLMSLICHVEVQGLHNIPRDGVTSLMINHVSFLDPLVVTASIPFRHTISLSKAENFKIPLVSWLLAQWGNYPINRGEFDRKALLQTIELMKTGQLLLMAPEGTRRAEGLQPGKDGLAFVATKADAVIVPTAICGGEDWKARIKRLRRAYAKVVFGRPFRFRADGQSRIPRPQLSQMINEAMYQLAITIPDEYAHLRGHYSDVENATTDLLDFV